MDKLRKIYEDQTKEEDGMTIHDIYEVNWLKIIRITTPNCRCEPALILRMGLSKRLRNKAQEQTAS